MIYNPIITTDTSILTFDWYLYESLKDESAERGSKKKRYLESFTSKMLFSKILHELAKIPLIQCVVDHKGEPLPVVEDGQVNGGRFISIFKEEIYGRFPGVQITSAAALTFMAMVAHESRSNLISGSQNSNPGLCAAVPPILAAFKNQFPYSAWSVHHSVAPFLLGKDLASAESGREEMILAVEEIRNIQEAKGMGFEAIMAIVSPPKNKCWEPRNISSAYQIPKPKTGQPVLATNFNGLDGFQKSMILNTWFFAHDHPDMIVNIEDYDSRERMWVPVDTKREVEVQTEGLFSMLKGIKNQYIPEALEEVLLKKPKATPKVTASDTPW